MIKLIFILLFGILSNIYAYEIKDLKADDNSYERIKKEQNSDKLLEIYNNTDLDIIKSKVLLNEFIPVKLLYDAIGSKNARLINSAKENILYTILTSKDKTYLEKQLTSTNQSIIYASKVALNQLSKVSETPSQINTNNLSEDYILKITNPSKLEEIYFSNPNDQVKIWIIRNPYLSLKIYKDIREVWNLRLVREADKTILHKMVDKSDLNLIEKYLDSDNYSLKDAARNYLGYKLEETNDKNLIKKYFNSNYKYHLLKNGNLKDSEKIDILSNLDKTQILTYMKSKPNMSRPLLEWFYNHDDKDIYDSEGKYLPKISRSFPSLIMRAFDKESDKIYNTVKWSNGLKSIGSELIKQEDLAEKYIINSDNYIENLTKEKSDTTVFYNIVDTYLNKNDVNINNKIELLSKISEYDKNSIKKLYDRYISREVSEASVSNKLWLKKNVKDASGITYSFTENIYAFFVLSIIGNLILLAIFITIIAIYMHVQKKNKYLKNYEEIKNSIAKYKNDLSIYFINFEEYGQIAGFNEIAKSIERLRLEFLGEYSSLEKIENFSNENGKKLNGFKSTQNKNEKELQNLIKQWDELSIEIKPLLEKFDSILGELTSEIMRLENNKSKVQEIYYLNEFEDLYKKTSNILNILLSLKHNLNSNINTIDELEEVLNKSEKTYTSEKSNLNKLYLEIDKNMEMYNLNSKQVDRLNKDLNTLKTNVEKILSNKSEIIDFKEAKEITKKLTEIKSNTNQTIATLSKESTNLSLFIENIKDCENKYKKLNLEYISQKELFDNLEIEFKNYHKNLDATKSKLSNLTQNLQTLLNNKIREFDKFSEIKSIIKKLKNLELSIKELDSQLNKKSNNINSFIQNIKSCQNKYIEIDEEYITQKELFDNLKIELERYNEIAEILSKTFSKIKKSKKDLDKYKNLISVEDYNNLLDQIDKLEKFIDNTLSSIFEKLTRKNLAEINSQLKSFENDFENFEKIYNSKFKLKKEFDNLPSFEDKKAWVLENGFVSWLFNDEKVKTAFEFLDDYKKLKLLLDIKMNKHVKWFPYNYEIKDDFYSKIKENSSKEEIKKLHETAISNVKGISKIKNGKEGIELDLITTFVGIQAKL